MFQFLSTPAASVVLGLALAAALIAIGVYVVGRVRREWAEDTAPASDMMANFRELHSQGGLSDQEYRTIKAMLGEQLKQELNRNDQED